MAVLPTVPNPSNSSSTPSVKSLEGEFVKLPADILAAEMWITAMKNLSELSGPAAIALMEQQKENFAQFCTSVSFKQNFYDAVKNTARERGYSKGITRKMQKLVNEMKVRGDT